MKSIFTLFIIVLMITTNSFTAKAQVDVNDSLALVDLYNNTNGSNWYNKTNWLSANPVITWYGIIVTDNRVVKIEMPYNNMTGPLPSTISNLTNLYFFSINNNHISGQLPATITTLSNLQYLYLAINDLTGTIPEDIGNLTQLQYLSFYDNKLEGTIPASFTSLQNLVELSLDDNKLEGTINPEFFNMPKLTSLGLGGNKLTGTIPDNIGNAVAFTELALYSNKLTGKIPSSIGKLINLDYCDLSDNKLSGKIPYSMGNLVKLNYLYLQHNNFKGIVPASFIYLRKLYYLDVSYNNLTQPENKTYPFAQSSGTRFTLSHNRYTFNGLESLATKVIHSVYSPQASIAVHQTGNTLSVFAGGTLSNNTYKWFKVDGSSTTITGDSTYSPTTSGMYYVTVTNAIATKLTLYSDTIDFTVNNLTINSGSAAHASITNLEGGLQVYPNPAKDVVYIQINGSANISVINSDGKTLLAKSINNSGEINVSKLAAGIYYITNKTIGKTQKILIVH